MINRKYKRPTLKDRVIDYETAVQMQKDLERLINTAYSKEFEVQTSDSHRSINLKLISSETPHLYSLRFKEGTGWQVYLGEETASYIKAWEVSKDVYTTPDITLLDREIIGATATGWWTVASTTTKSDWYSQYVYCCCTDIGTASMYLTITSPTVTNNNDCRMIASIGATGEISYKQFGMIQYKGIRQLPLGTSPSENWPILIVWDGSSAGGEWGLLLPPENPSLLYCGGVGETISWVDASDYLNP